MISPPHMLPLSPAALAYLIAVVDRAPALSESELHEKVRMLASLLELVSQARTRAPSSASASTDAAVRLVPPAEEKTR